MKRMDEMIEQVNGSMNIEGMPLTREDKEHIRGCASSEKLVEAEVQAIMKKHSLPAANAHEQRL